MTDNSDAWIKYGFLAMLLAVAAYLFVRKPGPTTTASTAGTTTGAAGSQQQNSLNAITGNLGQATLADLGTLNGSEYVGQIDSILTHSQSAGQAISELQRNINSPFLPGYIPTNVVSGGTATTIASATGSGGTLALNAQIQANGQPTMTFDAAGASALLQANPQIVAQPSNPFAGNGGSYPRTVAGVIVQNPNQMEHLSLQWQLAHTISPEAH